MLQCSRLASAIAFYTCLPVPLSWATDFQKVACFAPLVGVLVGGLLGALVHALEGLGIPPLTRSAITVVAWVAITGGLHLDGAMDMADGLAVPDSDRRLEVMADSRSGAFGVMAAIAIILLKTAALNDLSSFRWFSLMLAAGWGRWAQQVAIARYPYLKPTGKGAFHKEAIRSLQDTIPSLLLLVGISAAPLLFTAVSNQPFLLFRDDSFSAVLGLPLAFFLFSSLIGAAIAILAPAYIHRRLGGHTGDTYGAVVEWTEALLLIGFTVF